MNYGTSLSAIPFKSNFVKYTYKSLSSIIILEIVSRLKASGIGSVAYKINDDNKEYFDLQIDWVLHLENLLTHLMSA